MDSHEKQSPQRFVRYAAMLIMLLTLGVGQMWATKTIYYANPNDWDPPYCYAWGTGNNGWPGKAMTATDHKKDGHTIYKIDLSDSYTKCIFSNNGANQTGDITFTAGKVTSDGTTWYTYDASYWDAEYGSRNIYLDISNNTGWKVANGYVGFHTYYSPVGASEDYKARYDATLVEGNIYVVTASTINSAYVRSFKAARWSTSGGDDWNSSNQINANTSKNKLIVPSNGWTGCTLTWGVYVPTVSSVALSYSVVPSSGAGTEGNPYRVPAGTTVRVTATPTSVVTDNQCTMKYSWDSGSYGTTAYKDLNCSTGGSTYSTTVTCKNYISSDGGNTASATVYFLAVSDPTVTLTSVSPSTSIIAGNDITLVGSRANSTNAITFQYTTNDGSTWTTITPKTTSGDSPKTITWTIPDAHGATQTYKFRACLAADSKESAKSSGVTVYNTKTLHVKNSNNWASLYLYAWDSGGETINGAWPGTSGAGSYGLSCTKIGGLWWNVVVTSQVAGFILNANESGDNNQTVNLSYNSYSDDNCYAIGTDNGKKYMPNSTVDCLTDAAVSTSSVTPTVNNQATIGGNVTDLGNDMVTSYGYYYSSTNSSLAGNNLTGSTRVEVGTNKTSTGTYSKNQTGLTGGTTYYVIAYATNGNGTVYGSRQSFTTPYKVTLTNPTGGTFSSSGVKYVSSTLSVSITATTGYTFSSWSAVGCAMSSTSTTSGVTTATLTPSADNATLTANYTENSYSVSVSVSPAATGSISSPTPIDGKITVKQVTGTSVTATPAINYVFKNWTYSGGGLTSSSTTKTSTFKATTTGGSITANFADMWNVKGDQWDNWNTYNGMPYVSSNTFRTSFSLPAKTTYHFKVVKRADAGGADVWYGVDGGKTLTRASNSVTGLEAGGGGSEYITFTTDVAGDYTITYLYNASVGSMKVTVGYPTAYTVTFGKGTGGGTITASATSAGGSFTSGSYVASGDDVTFAQTASSGYTFSGWYTTKDTGGSAVTGMGVGDNVLENVTSNKTVWSRYTANNYTVTFDKNGGTVTPSPTSKSVTFGSAYGELPSGMKHTSKTFVGWFTESSGGTQVTAETIVSTASNHTLYAQYENVYAVNVDFKCEDAKVYPSTVVSASPTSLTPTIIAPEIFGYHFDNWSGSNVTFADRYNDTTTITATAATTVTANYSIVPTVYFKNNLGWDSVFVSFNITWAEKGGKQVPVNKDKPYYKMTQIGTTDIYYCEIPSTYTASNYTGWSANIAFDNTNYGKTATTTHSGTWDDFYGGEFLGRGDFDPKATLFIPYKGDTEARNNGTFYKTGCWMKYNSTESGYQVNMNTWVNNEHADTLTVALTAANAGGYEFSAKLNLQHPNYTYGFKLYKIYQKSDKDLWYTNCPATITAATDDLPWHFWSGTSVTATSERCGLRTEALGDYTITVSFATGRPMVNVEYPTQVGDWRLAYNDRAAWSGDKHEASWYIYSRVIKAKANAVDTVSFYVNKADSASAHIELQKCTAINSSTGAETWTKQGSNLELSSIPGTGIYNFKVTQNGSKDVTSAVSIGGYEGNFYIRTDVSDGGWTNYKNASNVMTYSEYAKDHSGFTHYYMRYVKNTGTNIKFCIANDYSPRLTEYCIDDDYTGENIAANGNVRFMWDHRTNKVSRAYISGSTHVSDRFLVLEGDAKMFDEKGKALTTAGGGKISGLNDYEMKFIDDQNWIYEATIQAQPGARAKLTAKYNNKIQYFGGSGSGSTTADSILLINGAGTDKYPVRVVYDFKTNRLIKAFLPPDGDIRTELAIEADLMIIREHQEDAKQITFTATGKLSEVKTVYGAMKFNKYTVNGKSKESGHASTGASRFERDLFYISFPFDVKLNEAFGFGTYGKHWIIEYYDGKGRAANGFWADSDPNWKFVTPSERNAGYTMKAFEGYILALDLDELTESSDVWNNGVENVYIYFPSSALVKDIAATNRLVTIDQTGYECTINRNTPDGDRRVKDSYWHCIGVPSFANYSSALYDTNGGTLINWSDANTDSDGDQWTTPNLPYLYEVDLSDKSLSVTSTNPFHFKATWSYLVQYEKSSIYWSNVNVTPAAIVARERKAPTNAEFRIELQQAGKKADQTFVRLTDEENITTGFDFNYDLSKEFNKNKANIYTMVTTGKEDGPSITEVAGNVQPMTEQTTVVPMGVTIAKAGEYTISIPSGTSGIGVTLVDNETGIRTNLALEDYTIALEAGTQNDRFYLEISPIKHVATGVEEITGDGSQVTGARKVMVDGILYIIKDGKVFSTQGARVK